MIVDSNPILADFQRLLIIDATVEQALAETARAHKRSVDEVRSAATSKFGNLSEFAWNVATNK